jgi:transposase
MTRRCGRVLRSKRLVASVPHGHWKTTTFIGASRLTGMSAPLVFDGPINGVSFLEHVRQALVPTLMPGDIVILDNLSSHKVESERETIEAAGASVRCLPPYSPDLNPIENAFAKLKSMLRKAGARTVSDLWITIGEAVRAFSPDECRDHFRLCSYVRSVRICSSLHAKSAPPRRSAGMPRC